ncbi:MULTISPECIES: GNAT family N-acetyltransferase [Faecalicoccus]|uniref:GNAT family N-acetyltransferase n=1 Tax=Faecalicoccus TaxID=1573536 RepID=UPI002943E70A|nr:GNAT family N-acetyltransferase [Faecalicoccus pleomorphus]
MTILDKSVPFIRVLMVMPRKTVRKEIPLNTKYQYVKFDDTLKEAWCKLQLEVGLFDSLAQAKEKWESMLKEDRAFFVQNFLFVADQQGELVASAGLWPGHDFEEKRLRVHFVAVKETAQHQKIAQSMLTKLCMKYDEMPGKYPLYLVTQSQSYGAIALYARLGFTPYLGATDHEDADHAQEAWEKVTQILREKAVRH